MPGENVYDRIRELREALGLTQEELAARSGGRFDRIRVNKIENGRNKLRSYQARAGLAEAFGVPPDLLASYVDGTTQLEEVLRFTSSRKSGPTPDIPRLRKHPHWSEL